MKTSITFQTEAEKCVALDAIAGGLEQDRAFVINQAIDAYLNAHHDVSAWQVAHIEEGQRQAERGEFVTQSQWRGAFHRHRREGTL